MKTRLAFYILLTISLFPASLSAQNKLLECNIPVEQRKQIKIQEVTLGDSTLIKEIEKLIAEESEQNEMFRKGLGYITVSHNISLPSRFASQENLIRSYYINVDYTGLKNPKQYKDAYLAYPSYYSFVGGRPVFIRFDMFDAGICHYFTKHSMRKIRKIQGKFLEKTQKLILHDTQGNKIGTDKNFRIDYHKLHGGKYIYIYKDGFVNSIDDPYKPNQHKP